MGSSGSLLYRGFGAEINAHDVVVRINGAVTAGYENDCGVARQPGIVTGWWKGLEDAERAGSLCCGAHALVSTALAIGPSERAVLQAEAAGATTTRLSRSFMKQTCHEQILGGVGNWPSTGFIALAAALAVAQECIHIHTNIRLHTHTYTYPVAYAYIHISAHLTHMRHPHRHCAGAWRVSLRLRLWGMQALQQVLRLRRFQRHRHKPPGHR